MAFTRTVVVAGAGIAGLTAALTLARRGLHSIVLEQAERLQELGAGLQLSPNASRILIDLGLAPRLEAAVVAPNAIRVRAASGRDITRFPLTEAATRYGAPYWVIHRGDLQAALSGAVRGHADITVKLGCLVEDFAVHSHGVTVQSRRNGQAAEDFGLALIGADGLWSNVRARLPRQGPPQFRGRTAWRALVPAKAVAAAEREPLVNLWVGNGAHLVHYPVRAGAYVNVVAIVEDDWRQPGWSAPGERDEILARFSRSWGRAARELLAVPQQWQKWALYDRPGSYRGGRGPVTLIGDAAHPMLPFLAQGAAMAIEDAAVLADALAMNVEQPAVALRAYEAARASRTERVQRAARRNGSIYGLGGARGLARNLFMRAVGGNILLRRYDWLYNWRPPAIP